MSPRFTLPFALNVLLKVTGWFAVRLPFRVNVPLKVDGSLKVAEPIFTLVNVTCCGKVAIPITLSWSTVNATPLGRAAAVASEDLSRSLNVWVPAPELVKSIKVGLPPPWGVALAAVVARENVLSLCLTIK